MRYLLLVIDLLVIELCPRLLPALRLLGLIAEEGVVGVGMQLLADHFQAEVI